MNKKIKPYYFIVPLVVYPFDVLVSIGQSDDELKEVLLKHEIKWEKIIKLDGTGRYILLKGNQSIIRTKNIVSTCEDYGILQHEIFHCVTYILDRIGMKFNLHESDEAYSYLIQYLTEKIYENLK